MKKLSFKEASRAALVCGLMLAGCSTSPQGRKQITAPLPVSQAYSEADLRIKLATASTVATPCAGVECTRNQLFDAQVQELGGRLAQAAFDLYPELIQRVSAFQFEVVEKAEPGMTSNAAGKIVVYRGVQELGLDEAGLAFLLAREMGHVIGRHHDENSATRVLLSVAVGVLFPALHLFGGTTAVAQQATQITSATSLTTAAASTAASYVGSQAILAGLKPDQLSEADLVALGLLEKEGWHLHDVASVLNLAEEIKAGGTWVEDLRVSISHLQTLDAVDQSTDISNQAGAIVLNVERECSAGPPDQDVPEPSGDMPVMAKEIAPLPVAEEHVPEAASEAAPMSVEAVPEESLAADSAPVAEAGGYSVQNVAPQASPTPARSHPAVKKMRAGNPAVKGKPPRQASRKKTAPGKTVKSTRATGREARKAVKPKSGSKRKVPAKSKPAR